jgi:hypothetical protein
MANYWIAAVLCAAGVAVAAPPVATQDFMVPAQDPGIELHLRNVHAVRQDKPFKDKIVLFVHGATFPYRWLRFRPAGGLVDAQSPPPASTPGLSTSVATVARRARTRSTSRRKRTRRSPLRPMRRATSPPPSTTS